MSKRKSARLRKKAQTENFTPGRGNIITFGEPEPILTTGTEYINVWYNGSYDYWMLPIDRLALAQLPNLNAQHGGVLYARKNMVCAGYQGGGLTTDQMEMAVFDYLLFGDVAFLKVRNGWGRVVDLVPLPSLYLRRNKQLDFIVLQEGDPLVYSPSDIVFLRMHDPRQQIYGLPDYIGGIHSALLNSEATIFRRRYYHNGAHMGFIMYATDPNMSVEAEEAIRKKIESGNGLGNFRNMFISIPKGSPDGVKIIPVGDISQKDEFANVKNISAQDVLTAHRFPAGLAGIIPQNATGLGDPDKARATYGRDEVTPVRRKIMQAVNSDPEIPPSLHLNFTLEDVENTASAPSDEK
ncbi:phage portal protein [Salmonella enterica subsp. diarizonae]|nr:phage portal protein [Salmonella enterica subsp. diarizonae]ECF5966003.1 phage portal protein [Salmonella enterica subsp. diarizonae]